MTDELTQIATFEDEVSAEILAGMLRNEGIPAEVQSVSPLPGLVDEVKVYVATSHTSRAQELMKSSKVSAAELRFAATGETDPAD